MSKPNHTDSRNQHIIRPEARRREPLPRGEVKIRAPKASAQPPTKPSLATILPSVLLPLVMGIVLFLNSKNATSLLAILPGLIIPGLLWGKYRADLKKHNEEAQQREDSYRSYLSQIQQQLEDSAGQQQRILWQENPSVGDMIKRVERQGNLLWERLPDDDDFLALRIGSSSLPLSVDIKTPDLDDDDPLLGQVGKMTAGFRHIPNLPVTTNINTLGTLGVRGQRPEEALQLAYTLLMHLVTHHSPDLVRVYVISHRPYAEREWGWVRWLPHSNAVRGGPESAPRLSFSPDTDDEVLAPLSQILRQRLDEQHRPGGRRYGDPDPHLVVVLDQVPELRGHPVLTILLGHKPGREGNRVHASAIFVDNPPAQVNALVWVRGTELEYRETWMPDANQVFIQGTAELTPLDRADHLSRLMAPLRTEASYNAGGGGLPSSVRLVELLGATHPLEIDLEKLYGDKYDPKKVMSFPIGLNVDLKPMNVILREDGQGGYGHHAMLAGGTGKGKSVTLQSIVLSLAANNSPAHLNFVLADFKGGASELARLKNLPHVVGFVNDLDEAYVERFRQSLEGEVRRRKKIFDSTPQTIGRQIQNIYEYNKACPNDMLPHLVIVIDEFAKALQINPDFKTTMDKDIAAQGRALGIHLILSTQKAADFASVRQNVEVRMSMQTNTAEDSKAIFNRDDAARKLTRAGQAFLQVGDNQIFEMFQAARADTPYIPDGTINLDLLDDFIIHRLMPDGHRELLYRHNVANRPEKKAGNTLSEAEVLVDHIRRFCQGRYLAQRTICLPPLPEPAKMPLFPLLADSPAYCRWQGTTWDVKQKQLQHRLRAPLGMLDLPGSQEQRPFFLDLNQRDGNYIVAGPTGSGKGLFLRSLVMALAATHTPDELLFYLHSRSATLSVFETLPQCQALIQATEAERIRRFFAFLQQEEAHRLDLMRDHRKDNMAALRESLPGQPLPALVVVFEDFAGFITENPDRLSEIEGLTARGKQVDLHLILSVPAIRAVHPRIQQNMLNRLVLGVKLESDTIDILGRRAQPLPEIAGRGYITLEQEAIECQIAAPARRAGIKPELAEAIEEIQEIVTAMNRGWTWTDGKRPLPPIAELPKYVELEPFWQLHRSSPRVYEQPTAPLGLDYNTLAPVTIDYNVLEQYNLVLGPMKSGKTDFLLSLCLATAFNVSPDNLELYIFAFKMGSPLQLLRPLPHVHFANNPKTARENLTALKISLDQRTMGYHQTMEQTATNLIGLFKTAPKRTVLIVDDLLQFSRTDDLNKLLDQCMDVGTDIGITRLILADSGNSINQVKQNFGIKYVQNASRYGSGVAFSTEQNDLTLLNMMGKVPQAMLKLHAPHIGKGRAFWSYLDQVRVVQFGRVGPENASKERYEEQIKQLVEYIVAKYTADSSKDDSPTVIYRLP